MFPIASAAISRDVIPYLKKKKKHKLDGKWLEISGGCGWNPHATRRKNDHLGKNKSEKTRETLRQRRSSSSAVTHHSVEYTSNSRARIRGADSSTVRKRPIRQLFSFFLLYIIYISTAKPGEVLLSLFYSYLLLARVIIVPKLYTHTHSHSTYTHLSWFSSPFCLPFTLFICTCDIVLRIYIYGVE